MVLVVCNDGGATALFLCPFLGPVPSGPKRSRRINPVQCAACSATEPEPTQQRAEWYPGSTLMECSFISTRVVYFPPRIYTFYDTIIASRPSNSSIRRRSRSRAGLKKGETNFKSLFSLFVRFLVAGAAALFSRSVLRYIYYCDHCRYWLSKLTPHWDRGPGDDFSSQLLY